MSEIQDNIYTSALGAAAISQYVRVKVTAAATATNPITVDVAAATDQAIGYADETGIASGGIGRIRLLAPPYKAVASKSFSVGASLFAAASGKVTDTQPADGKRIGVAGSASGGDGSVVLVFRVDPRDHT